MHTAWETAFRGALENAAGLEKDAVLWLPMA
jgi:hypothetical protein